MIFIDLFVDESSIGDREDEDLVVSFDVEVVLNDAIVLIGDAR